MVSGIAEKLSININLKGEILKYIIPVIFDFPYLIILWVTYGIFLPGLETLMFPLLIRYWVLIHFRNINVFLYLPIAFLTTSIVYILPFYLSSDELILGIKAGVYGDFRGIKKWSVISGASAMLCWMLSRVTLNYLDS